MHFLRAAFAGALSVQLAFSQQAPAGAGAGAQAANTKATDQTYSAIITSTSQEVLLDVVVRDKKGRLVKDLKKEEIEVTDEGVKQSLRSFRLVQGQEAAAENTAPAETKTTAAPALNPLRDIRLVTFLFEGLGRLEADNARHAAMDFLKTETGPNLYFAVFTIDQRLLILQQYTPDKKLAEAAITRATSGSAYSLYSEVSNRISDELKALSAMQTAASASAPAGGPPSAGGASSMANAAMAQMSLNMIQFSRSAENTQQSRASVFGLRNLVREQHRLPGRKTLLYFTSGLRVQPELEEEYRTIMATANRANVSFYTVDARGLMTEGQNTEAGAVLKQAIASSASMQTSRSGAVTPDQAKVIDTATSSIRSNTQNKLAELAENTGGFFVGNSNEFKNHMRRVSEDINSYYEVSYSPQIENFDGSIRRLAVKVTRPDVTVYSRTFYYALPFVDGGQQLLGYEVPMIRAMSANPVPRNVPFRVSGMHFRTQEGKPNTAFVFDVPLSELTFERNEAAKSYKAHFSVMALVKSPSGSIVQKLSRDVPTEGPIENVDALKAGHFIYTQHLELAPGRYTVESAVMDHQNTKLGVKKQVLMVPETPQGLGISNLAMVRTFNPAAAKPTDLDDPFQFDGGKVTPSLEDTVKGGKGSIVSVYFHVYKQMGVATEPALTLEFLQDGKMIGKGDLQLPAADASGRIPYVASMPVESLQPGQYEMRAVVRQGDKAVSERVLVNIE